MTKHSMSGRALKVAAASGIVLGVLVPTTAAMAATYPNGGGGGTATDPGSQVAANTATNNASTLPFTGSDVAGVAVIGAGAVLAGVVMVRQSKKHRATA